MAIKDMLLGKIKSVGFGFNGYQDQEFGLRFVFLFSGGTSAVWKVHTEDHLLKLLKNTLILAKKKDISELVGVPIRAFMENGSIGRSVKDWQVLTEVL